MQGILVLDKPQGFTSFDAVAKLRGICATRKIGHSGTLDPMATGVLPVFVGAAAKAVDMQTDHTKAYDAVMRVGLQTDTGDITGEVLRRSEAAVTETQVKDALARFTGVQQQLPPMYSAVKVNGQPLYKAARRGETVERAPREITVFAAEYQGQPAENEFAFHVECSKGTYIRTLIEDIGASLGVCAAMSALRRTRSGCYTLAQAYGFDALQQARDEGRLSELLMSVDTVFMHLPALPVTEQAFARLVNGAPVYRTGAADGEYRLYCGKFIGVGTVQAGTLTVRKLFLEQA